MARLTLTLLGGFQARLGAGPPLTLRTKKLQAFLAYLAVPPGREHTRDKLATVLWGDLAHVRARNSLRQALFALRQAVEAARPACFRVEGAIIALSRDAVDVDAVTFEQLVGERTPEALTQAVNLYRGDLLEGLALQEPPFEEWLMAERGRLRELALEALARLLASQRAAGAIEAALQTGLRLIALDPLQEPVHRALMRLYAELGRRGSALQRYQLCVGVLQHELGVEPEAETKQLYQEILRSARRPDRFGVEAPPAVSPSPSAVRTPTVSTDVPLVGREQEMARLRIALDEARRGEGRFVVVQGEAGVGKSRLIAELATETLKVDCCVLLGRCHEAEQILPFGPWVDALRSGGIIEAMESLRSFLSPWHRDLARLLPELEPDAADSEFASPDHTRLFEAVTALLRRLAGRQPVVLILEDLHWADEMTLRLLTFLSHRVQGQSILVVATAREEELTDVPMLRRTLEELDREAHVVRLELASLTQADTVNLVRLLARAGSNGSELVQLGEEIWRTSEGNPFVVVEAMRAVNQGVPAPGSANPSLPGRVREGIARRLDRLSELSRRLVAMAAVFGREFEFALLQRAAAIDEREAADGIEELVRRHLLQAVGNRFDFAHDRIREVVYGQLLSPRRKLLHRVVAEAMESLYSAELERHHLALGVHYREGEVWDRARTHFRQAGITAFSRGAFRDSVACLQQARGLPDDPLHDGRKSTLAIDLRFNLHNSLWALGDMKSILGCLGEAALRARELGDEVRQGRAAAYTCHYWWTSGDNVEALRAGEEARTLAAKAGDPALLAETNFGRGLVCQSMGQYRRATDLFLANLAIIDTNRAAMAQAFRVNLSAMYLARCLAELGDFEEGLKYARQCVELTESSGGPFGISGAYFGLGHLHIRKADVPGAISVLEQGMAVCRAHSVENALPATAASLGYAYLLAGRGDEALPLLEQAVHRARAMGVFASYAQWLIYLAEGYLLVGETGKAHQSAQQALQHARAQLERGHEAQAVRLLADILLRHDPLDADSALASYRHAISAAEELGMRPFLARCHFELGSVSLRIGDGRNGKAHLRTAADLFREMGLDGWLTRAESRIREMEEA